MTMEQRGATLVDSLVALTVLCLAVPVIAYLSQCIRTAQREALEIARFDRSVLQAEHLLRKELARIRVPPELAIFPVLRVGSGLRLYYLNGNPRAYLEMGVERGAQEDTTRFVLTDSETGARQAVNLVAASLRIQSPYDEEPMVRLDVEGKGEMRAHVIAAVGSWPLH